MTANLEAPPHGSCACGICAFESRKLPTARFICHCTFCQAFTGKPFSDVTVLRARHVVLKNANRIEFRKYRRLPPNLNRGRCENCGKQVVETAGFGPFKLLFIPSDTFASPHLLPLVHMHVFYTRRLQDVHDDLPEHSGYWPSQMAIGSLLLSKL